MNYYPIGSICEVLYSATFPELTGEIVTITHNYYIDPLQTPEGPYVGYLVNDGEIRKIIPDRTPPTTIFVPKHEQLRLITPPPEGSGLEMILGMFDKMKVPELA